ncbi:MAG: hypothetical protein H6Q69_4742, partial [Firmicutes bacterium]|nr:hypothetical protein [Bacillota bacterium]
KLGKAWGSNDSKSGELPIQQSPLKPARDGEEIRTVILLYITHDNGVFI